MPELVIVPLVNAATEYLAWEIAASYAISVETLDIILTVGGYLAQLAGAYATRALFGGGGENAYGPRLSDLAVQSSADGEPIAIPYGTIRLAGNIIWSTGLEETAHTTSSGGGGSGQGSSSSTTTYTYKTDVAIAICEGPITGIRKIWADSKLIYDISNSSNAESIALSIDSAANFKIYTGTEVQDPDPLMEAIEGTGNVPGYRGLAYIVFEDFQLEDFGNRIPNLTFEVVKVGSHNAGLTQTIEITPDEMVDGTDAVRSAINYADIDGIYRIQLGRTATATYDTELYTKLYALDDGKQSVLSNSNVTIPILLNPLSNNTVYLSRGNSDTNAAVISIVPSAGSGLGGGLALLTKNGVYNYYTNNYEIAGAVNTWSYSNNVMFWSQVTNYTGIYKTYLFRNGQEFTLDYTPYQNPLNNSNNYFKVEWMASNSKYLIIRTMADLGTGFSGYLSILDAKTLSTLNTVLLPANIGVGFYVKDDYLCYIYAINANNKEARYIKISDIDNNIINNSTILSGIDKDYNYILNIIGNESFGILIIKHYNNTVQKVRVYTYGSLNAQKEDLDVIISDILDRVLDSSEYDVSTLVNDKVRGYAIKGNMAIREAINGLSIAHQFGIIEEDGKIKIRKNNSISSVDNISREYFGSMEI